MQVFRVQDRLHVMEVNQCSLNINQSQLHMCHCTFTTSLVPARLHTRLRLTSGRCVHRRHHFLRFFLHPRLPCGSRQPSAPSRDLDLAHAQVEHSHENHHLVHMQEDPPSVVCRGRVHCCRVHRRSRWCRCLSRLSRSGHHRNHPKPLVVAIKYFVPMSAVFTLVSITLSPNKPLTHGTASCPSSGGLRDEATDVGQLLGVSVQHHRELYLTSKRPINSQSRALLISDPQTDIRSKTPQCEWHHEKTHRNKRSTHSRQRLRKDR